MNQPTPKEQAMDRILSDLYAVISGPAGSPRDWDRFFDLFQPEQGRLAVVVQVPGAPFRVVSMTPEQYRVNAERLFAEAGFFEIEIGRTVETFGAIAQVFSSYESRREPEGKPFDRGINSFQLVWNGERWFVLSVLWDRETESQPIPSRYLADTEL